MKKLWLNLYRVRNAFSSSDARNVKQHGDSDGHSKPDTNSNYDQHHSFPHIWERIVESNPHNDYEANTKNAVENSQQTTDHSRFFFYQRVAAVDATASFIRNCTIAVITYHQRHVSPPFWNQRDNRCRVVSAQAVQT